MSIETIAPILDSTQPAFDKNIIDYTVYYKLNNVSTHPVSSNINDTTSLESYIELTVKRQSDNLSVLNNENTSEYIRQQIIATPLINENGYYSVKINREKIKDGWQAGVLYKIQMRFYSVVKIREQKEIKKNNETIIEIIEKETEKKYSEWSNVLIIKAIDIPTVKILNAFDTSANTKLIKSVETDNFPLFTGKCVFSDESKEFVDKYRFLLYSKSEKIYEQEEVSDWLQHNVSDESLDNYRFKTYLEEKKDYKVIYEIISNNKYNTQSKEYDFNIVLNQLSSISNECILNIDNIDREKGCVRLKLQQYVKENSDKTRYLPMGNYVLMRSDETSNYKLWQDLQFYYNTSAQNMKDKYFYDYTIESGVKYKYAIVFQNKYGMRSQRAEMQGAEGVSLDLEYAYLYRNGIQLDLKYNVELSSFKNTTLTNKSDTLGSKYPTISRNGMAYYTEFPITGLISFQMDSVQDFFTWKNDGYYYNNELVIPKDKFHSDKTMRNHCDAVAPGSTKTNTIKIVNSNNNSVGVINSDLTEDNTFIERKFREKVEEFLNDGKPKLFRSSTEGNKVVVLMGVSLSPQKTLGRIIYNFSATAYEVIENTLDNLNDYGIIHIGNFIPFEQMNNDSISAGQIVIRDIANSSFKFEITEGNVNSPVKYFDIISAIQQQIQNLSVDDSNEYEYELISIDSFWFDYVDEFEKGDSSVISFKFGYSGAENAQTFYIMPYRTYALNQHEISGIPTFATLVENIIINYIATISKKEKQHTIIRAEESYIGYQQLSGIFTNDKKLIEKNKILNWIYDNNEYSEQENYYYDNYKTYVSLDLILLIFYYAQKQIKNIYHIDKFEKMIDEKGDNYYIGIDNAKRLIECKLNNIKSITIETKEITPLKIDYKNNDTEIIYVGPTSRYTLNPSEDLISGISFVEPSYAIIDVIFTSVQTIKE